MWIHEGYWPIFLYFYIDESSTKELLQTALVHLKKFS